MASGPNGREALFQFTRARGARPISASPPPNRSSFNSRAHGARDTTPGMAGARPAVSIHARTGRATRTAKTTACIGCFNSRAHGARDSNLPAFRSAQPVSIHARTGRATGMMVSTALGNRVSIHARTGRATRCGIRIGIARTRFNSRAHGARDPFQHVCCRMGIVSIHARTGRATHGTPHAATTRRFQFTRARGARPDAQGAAQGPAGFNSRAHGARDTTNDRLSAAVYVSIHARTGRATKLAEREDGTGLVSIHARTGRATTPSSRSQPSSMMFQFTRARGARLDRLAEPFR